MCIGLMPITGIPLPFISFGSSSMLMQCAAVGIVQSIWRVGNKSDIGPSGSCGYVRIGLSVSRVT